MVVHIPDANEKLCYTSFEFLGNLKMCAGVGKPSHVAVAEFWQINKNDLFIFFSWFQPKLPFFFPPYSIL